MKKNLFLKVIILLFLFAASSVDAQNWTWKDGSNLGSQRGTYGVKGMPSPANIPGARENSAAWKDSVGNFWLFGGSGYATQGIGTLNDLWKHDNATEQWTWVKGDSLVNQGSIYGVQGIPSATGKPGGRQQASYSTDRNGDFWMFGGFGKDAINNSGFLQELWKYDVSQNYWGWMKGGNLANQHGRYGIKGLAGATNNPGGRRGSVSWCDTLGNVWMFGGYGYPGGNGLMVTLNDMWKFNPVNGLWTWVSGDSTGDNQSVTGTLEVFSALNKPGSRMNMVSWTDDNGCFWVFSGLGYSTMASSGLLNDLWKFNPYIGQWACYKTCTILNQNGEYGTKGIESATNFPGGRFYSSGWNDGAGNLWLLGGYGKHSIGVPYDTLNDLWKYNTITKQWAWISGDSSIATLNDKQGVYGSPDIPAPANQPGVRLEHTGWTDTNGNIWLFGGSGYSSSLTEGKFLNDLWMYSTCAFLPPAPDNATPPISLTVCAGQGTTLSAHGIGNISWYDSPTAGTFLGAGNTLTVSSLASTTTFYAQDSTCIDGSRTAITVNVNPVYNYTESHSICNGQTYAWHGQSLTTGGTYYDNQTTAFGCDSNYTMTISVNPVYAYTVYDTICSGDTLTWQGTEYSTAGIHNAVYSSMNGCDSTYTLTLSFYTPTPVSFSGLNSLYCVYDPLVTLAGSPAGGIFSGTGISGSTFDPNTAGAGTFDIIYSYTDGNSCTYSDTNTVVVDLCIGINNISATNLFIYPNPSTGSFTLQLDESASIEIYSVLGNLIYAEKFESGKHNLSLNLTNGVYLLKASNAKGSINHRMVIQK